MNDSIVFVMLSDEGHSVLVMSPPCMLEIHLHCKIEWNQAEMGPIWSFTDAVFPKVMLGGVGGTEASVEKQF